VRAWRPQLTAVEVLQGDIKNRNASDGQLRL
jgi:hypothetical protein